MYKMIILIVALTIGFLASTAVTQVQAQTQQCDQRAKVLGQLARRYQEIPVAIGVTNKGGLIEVLTTPDGSTWTIIVTTPQGMSCLVAAGDGWRSLTPTILGPKV